MDHLAVEPLDGCDTGVDQRNADPLTGGAARPVPVGAGDVDGGANRVGLVTAVVATVQVESVVAGDGVVVVEGAQRMDRDLRGDGVDHVKRSDDLPAGVEHGGASGSRRVRAAHDDRYQLTSR